MKTIDKKILRLNKEIKIIKFYPLDDNCMDVINLNGKVFGIILPFALNQAA
jgi:hypothetical protein